MAEGDTSCSGSCCTYDSFEETRHVSLQGRGEGEEACTSGSCKVEDCTTEDGNSLIVHSPHRTHMPQEHSLSQSPTPSTQHCTRRLSTHSSWSAVLVVSVVCLLLLTHPALVAVSQDLPSPTLLYGLPDVVAVVGQPFSLTIPEDAFSGRVVSFEVCCHGTR